LDRFDRSEKSDSEKIALIRNIVISLGILLPYARSKTALLAQKLNNSI
jgi:hypothetical protein